MNGEEFIQEITHEHKKPVSIERDVIDLVVIEGVRYSGDYFRTLAAPETDMLYTVRRDGDVVWLTTIRNVEEAKLFFETVSATLTPTLSLKGEGEEGEQDVV